MMLSEMELPLAYEDCKDLALVYPYEVAAALFAAQESHGDPRHIAVGTEMEDGRWMMPGDILSEVGPDGILAWVLAHLDTAMANEIEVVSLSKAMSMRRTKQVENDDVVEP